MNVNNLNKKEILSLPYRDWNQPKTYHSILVLKGAKKHESKWSLLHVVGCMEMVPIEIVSSCSDVIDWRLSSTIPSFEGIMTDCSWGSGGLHFWSDRYFFKAFHALSSLTINIVTKQQNN